MALGQSADILLTIKADNTASKELKEVKGDVAGLETATKGAGAGFAALSGPASAAGAAILAAGAAATTAAIAIFNLSKNTADYGSALLNLQKQTGLSAAVLSTLQVAANNAGVSLDQVGDIVGELTQKLGEAAMGDEKAQEALKNHNITAKDTQTALAQLITEVNKYSDAERKAAVVTTILGDEGKKFLPVIAQMASGLNKATADAQKFGQTLSQSALEDSKRFSTGLKDLQTQASALGREFALELMPAITDTMNAITGVLRDNKGEAAAWAKALLNEIRTVIAGFRALGEIADWALTITTLGFINSSTASISWSSVIARSVSAVILPFYELIRVVGEARQALNWLMGGTDGSINSGPQIVGGNLRTGLGGQVDIPAGGGGARGGSGRGGGGGGSAAPQRDLFEEAKKQASVMLEAFQASQKIQSALNEQKLSNGSVDEIGYEREKARIRIAALEYELRLQQELTKLQSFEKASDEKKLEITSKIGNLQSEIAATEIANQTAISEAEADALDKAAADLREFDKLLEDAHKRELERIRKEELARDRRNKAAGQAAIDNDRARQAKLESDRFSSLGLGIGGGGSATADLTSTLNKKGMEEAIPVVESLRAAFNGLGQALGQVVSNWILYGNTAGQSAKKAAAGIIASVAQMAVVKAVFELAEGFAALARGWLFGDPAAFKSATMHFKSAATYGIVAGIAAGAGRAIAGDAFADSGGGGGGGSGSSSGNRPPLAFTERFGGFEDRIASGIDKAMQPVRVVMGGVADAVNKFNDKFGVTTPDAVVMAGAGGAGAAIFDATLGVMESDGGKATAFKRMSGDF